MRLVFDTNVYVSTFLVPEGKAALAVQLAGSGVFELVVSAEILSEVIDKLRSKFEYSESVLEETERSIREAATVIEPDVELSVLEDDPDNRILECAVTAGASAIVTGDRGLLALGSYEGIGIMTVADLLYSFLET